MTDRKARLAALAAKAGRNKKADDEGGEAAAAPKVNFRNYVPQDASLMPAPDEDHDDEEQPPVTKKPKLEEALEQAQQEVAASTKTLAVETKKVNWDLKRDLEPQIDKLERRTQKAIVELLRERLAKEAEEEELD